jgi:hypothetical protein
LAIKAAHLDETPRNNLIITQCLQSIQFILDSATLSCLNQKLAEIKKQLLGFQKM